MPLVRVTLVDGVFTEDQKHAMAADLTDVMVKYEGSEAFRELVWVILEEGHPTTRGGLAEAAPVAHA